MLFNVGVYKHDTGFSIIVTDDNQIMLTPNAPLALRLSEIFDTEKWTKIK